MNSATTSSAISELTRVLLDANIIAKPVTRTLLVVGGVTEDVDDYRLDDLASVGISAANPDLFLAARLTRDAYSTVIDLFVERQLNPPTTPAQFHAAIAKNHPRLFAAHADLYEVEPEHGIHGEPEVIFRGARCLRCEQIIADPATIVDGLGPECR